MDHSPFRISLAAEEWVRSNMHGTITGCGPVLVIFHLLRLTIWTIAPAANQCAVHDGGGQVGDMSSI